MSNDTSHFPYLDEDIEILVPGVRSRSLRPQAQKHHDSVYQLRPRVSEEEEVLQKLKVFGYFLIIGSWILLVVSVGFVFNLWKWCFRFDATNSKILAKYKWLETLYELVQEQNEIVDNYYIFVFFLSFVILWIWAVASWISMKLFRHSKGGGS